MAPEQHLPNGLIAYGPKSNCTLTGPDSCPLSASVYHYRPTLPGNSVFIALFSIALVAQLIQGVKWRTWAFMVAMSAGCICEIIGYAGRIILYQNPFSFQGFIMQISKSMLFLSRLTLGEGTQHESERAASLMSLPKSLHHVWSNLVHGRNLLNSLQNRHLSWARILALLSQVLLLDLHSVRHL